MGPAVFGYIRVSQAEGESGLATQRRIFTDVASGRNMRRPAWTTLREPLQPGVDRAAAGGEDRGRPPPGRNI